MEARISAVELIAFITGGGGTVTPADLHYLGRLASDPDTSGWGGAEEFYFWYSLTDHRGKYWDGSEILEF